MKKFRELRADEIECRVSTIKSSGLALLLYKDARCDMNILDEAVGPMNWQRSHNRENANCVVSIWDAEKAQWVSKEDTGTESFTEKEKGLASDSFKRACFNWGIGRELYTAPFIWVSSLHCEIQPKADKKGWLCLDKFYVSNIGYDRERRITSLQIKNRKTHQVVYELGWLEEQEEVQQSPSGKTEKRKELVTQQQQHHVRKTFEKEGIDECKVLVLYKLEKLEDMSVSQYQNAMSHIEELKGRCGV